MTPNNTKSAKEVRLSQPLTSGPESIPLWEEQYQELLNRPIERPDQLEQWLLDRDMAEATLGEALAWSYIELSRDTAHEEKRKRYEFIAGELLPALAPLGHELDLKFCRSSLELPQLPGFRQLKKEANNRVALFRKENVELQAEAEVLAQRYGAINGDMGITYGGQEFTLQQAARMLEETDPNKREQVWKAMQQRRGQDKNALDELLNKLIRLREQMALNAGFKNYRDYRHQELNRPYPVKDCMELARSVAQFWVPLQDKLAAYRKDKLGVQELRPWDLAVDPGGLPPMHPFHGAGELLENTKRVFQKLDPEFSKFLEDMDSNGLFDLESRKGKAPGGYNYPLALTRKPFIFMNSSDSLGDLMTMLHEGGHAMHTYLCASLPLSSLGSCPSEVAELASMSMEMMALESGEDLFGSKEDWIRARREHLEGILHTLPWVALIDQFQHEIYAGTARDPQSRDGIWESLHKRFSPTVVSWQGLEPQRRNLWQKQLHIYEVPFYYIEYGMAQLGAVSIWANFKKNPEKALEQYKAALKLGNTVPIPQVYAAAGIEFDFGTKNMEQLAQLVWEEWEQLNRS